MEIHKLQVTYYANSDVDGADTRSDASLNSVNLTNKFNSTEEVSIKLRDRKGFKLPNDQNETSSRKNSDMYSPTKTKPSLVSAGKISM